MGSNEISKMRSDEALEMRTMGPGQKQAEASVHVEAGWVSGVK
jgi:hypothetical protein